MLGVLSQDEISDWLRVSDAFIFPSKGEGLSMSVSEAMSCGVPVIGFDVVGIREMIKHGVNGYLLNERSDSNLFRYMIKIIENKDDLSKGALLSSQRYNSQSIANEIIKHIEVNLNGVTNEN